MHRAWDRISILSPKTGRFRGGVPRIAVGDRRPYSPRRGWQHLRQLCLAAGVEGPRLLRRAVGRRDLAGYGKQREEDKREVAQCTHQTTSGCFRGL